MARRRVSDEMLAILVVILFVVSMISFIPVARWSITVFGPINETGIAKVNLTIASETGCDFTDNRIDLGAGKALQENNSEMVGDWWILENTGTVNVTVNISVANSDWLFDSQAAPSKWWKYNCNASTTQSGNCLVTDYTQVESSLVTAGIALDGLEPSATIDEGTFGTNATVPDTESSGLKEGEILAFCVVIP